MAADRTHPFDVVLALRLLSPAGTMATIADDLAVAPSQVHAALGRLLTAGLLKVTENSRTTNSRALGEFLLFGVRYAFPAVRGPLADGVPTAWSAPALAAHLDAPDAVVWPTVPAAKNNTVRGFSIKPLYRNAVRLVSTSPDTYRLLTLVDAMRGSRARGMWRAHNSSRVWGGAPADVRRHPVPSYGASASVP